MGTKNNFLNQGNGNTLYIEINKLNFEFLIFRLIFISIFILIILLLINHKTILNKEYILNPIVLSIITIIIIRSIYNLGFLTYTITYDSTDYLNMPSFHYLTHGIVDQIRLPLYPLILDIMRYMFGEQFFLYFVVIIQNIISIISSYFLYKSVFIVSKNNTISITFILLYSINPGVFGWNQLIMTESLSLSITTIYIYFVIQYLFNKKTKFIYYSLIVSFISVFFHPTFLIFLILTLRLCIYRLIFEKQKNLIYTIYVGTICFVVIFSYATMFYKKYGYISLSSTVVFQQYNICIDRKYYRDTELYKKIQPIEQEQGKSRVVSYLNSIYDNYPKKIRIY